MIAITAARAAVASPPGAPPPDPYRVWLSEVMLQQTTVATVIPRFRRFVERWPTVEALAAAPDEEVLQRMGRAWLLRPRPQPHRLCPQVAAHGGFPASEAELRKLPGIGAYTAAAIAAIAFGERGDGGRHQCRARRRPAPRASSGRSPKRGRDPGRSPRRMTPADRPGDFAQAMMDLGATICRPKSARLRRPARSPTDCRAFASGTARAFPAPKAARRAPASPRRRLVDRARRRACGWCGARPRACSAGWRRCPARVARTRRPARRRSPRVRHGFTHFTLDLHIVARAEPVGDGWWQPLDRLAEAGLPTLYRRAAEAVLERRSEALAA